MLRPQLASSLRPPRSLARSDLFVPRARTALAKGRAFAIAGPSLWNDLHPALRSRFLTASLKLSSKYAESVKLLNNYYEFNAL